MLPFPLRAEAGLVFSGNVSTLCHTRCEKAEALTFAKCEKPITTSPNVADATLVPSNNVVSPCSFLRFASIFFFISFSALRLCMSCMSAQLRVCTHVYYVLDPFYLFFGELAPVSFVYGSVSLPPSCCDRFAILCAWYCCTAFLMGFLRACRPPQPAGENRDNRTHCFAIFIWCCNVRRLRSFHGPPGTPGIKLRYQSDRAPYELGAYRGSGWENRRGVRNPHGSKGSITRGYRGNHATEVSPRDGGGIREERTQRAGAQDDGKVVAGRVLHLFVVNR